jgi:acetylornithine deacetylase/succinyl-diaminopimelate desuccinylase-like protein
MEARFRAAGFAAGDIALVGADPRKQNLVVRLRGTGRVRPLLLLGHLDVVEARREDWTWIPSSSSRRMDIIMGAARRI